MRAATVVDVVVIASSDAEATRRCIESVRASRDAIEVEIVMGGADLAGAVGLHPDRDVVLLSGDCEVPPGWLDRLARCARGSPRVATVTAFSNDGDLCSYPRIGERNPLPEGYGTAALDAIFGEENRGCSIELPAAGGGCTYLTRAALSATGTFQHLAGFSDAATQAGFTHLLCADLFVRVESPAAAAAAARASAEARREFLEREPARPWRRNVDLARLRRSPRPRVLFVTHDWGGGVERHVNDLARLLASDCEVLRLRPDAPSVVELAWLREGEELRAWIDASEWESCIELLRGVGVSRVHIHHIHELPQAVLDLPAALGVPYDVTLHDHFPICPRYHLWPGEGERCLDLDGLHCDRCLARRPAQWGLALAEWRALFQRVLQGAERVIAPSHDTALRIRRYFPELTPLEWSHPETVAPAPSISKVALIGGVSEIKGARLLEACVADAAARRLPLHFHVVGHVDRPMKRWPEAPLTIGGSYPEASLERELIAVERPDAFLFLSLVPETYSYTLSTAMATGLPIVATRLGAFPERLRGYRRHVLVPADAGAAQVNDALLACLARGETLAASGAEG